MRLVDNIEGNEHEHEDASGLVGHMHLELRGPDGELKEVRDVGNLIVTTGSDSIMDQILASPAQVKPGWMAIGTGSTAPVAGNTALGTEIDRNALTSKTRAGSIITMVGDWAAGDGTNSAITEAGIMSAVSGAPAGTTPMYSRATFTAIDKQAADTLQITWTWTGTPS